MFPNSLEAEDFSKIIESWHGAIALAIAFVEEDDAPTNETSFLPSHFLRTLKTIVANVGQVSAYGDGPYGLQHDVPPDHKDYLNLLYSSLENSFKSKYII